MADGGKDMTKIMLPVVVNVYEKVKKINRQLFLMIYFYFRCQRHAADKLESKYALVSLTPIIEAIYNMHASGNGAYSLTEEAMR